MTTEAITGTGSAGWRRLRPGMGWLPVAVVVVLLTAWEIVARMGLVSQLFFPAPSSSAAALVRLMASGEMVADLWTTLWRLGRGFLLGATVGVLAGLVLGWSQKLHAAFNPLLALAHPIPKISLLPLFYIIFGLGDTSTVALVAISSFFPMAINGTLGVRQISPELFEVARSYRASRRTVFLRVVLPGSIPAIIAGARLALNSAIVVTIAIELISASEGLGANVWFAWQTLRTEQLYATLAVIATLGILTNVLLQVAERRLAPWRDR